MMVVENDDGGRADCGKRMMVVNNDGSRRMVAVNGDSGNGGCSALGVGACAPNGKKNFTYKYHNFLKFT